MAKREPHWVKLFLRELEYTGNVRLAAERAGVDFSSAYQRRKRHAEFAEGWEAALGAFRDGSTPTDADPSTAFSNSPPQPPAREELIARDAAGGARLERVGEGRWTKRAEQRFLTTLAECANVRRAAEAAGFSTAAVYARRLKHTAFAEAWDFALDTGKAKLEAMLIEAAQRLFDPDTLVISDKEPQVSVGEAIHLIKLRRNEPGRGPAQGGGRVPRVATPEEAEKDLIKRLKAFAARVQREDVANGWSVHEGHSIPPGWVRAEDARCAVCGVACLDRSLQPK